jgi:RNA polymerase sigma factor (sigma-70 family)
MDRVAAEGRTAETAGRPEISEAARKRAAVELIRRHDRTLRRTARRYSLCTDDAEDAYQRALEILLKKAPSEDQHDLIRWMQTVTKHEALAVRRRRERMLSGPAPGRQAEEEQDWVQLIPSERAGPADLAERRERIARSREALRALKPQELRALTLLAEGYSYAEIGRITGFSYTKINRCLAEGRQRFRQIVAGTETGERCREMAPLLSAFADGAAGEADTARVKEHLRACAHCRASLRAFRAAPGAAAALLPVLPVSTGLLAQLRDLVDVVSGRLPGRPRLTEAAGSTAGAGGAGGAGIATAVKVAAVCAGAAGGAAACVAGGVTPSAIGLGADGSRAPAVPRQIASVVPPPVRHWAPAPASRPAQQAPAAQPDPPPPAEPAPEPPGTEPEPAPPPPAAADPIEFTPAPAPAPAPAPVAAAPVSSPGTGGGGAGEFGP